VRFEGVPSVPYPELPAVLGDLVAGVQEQLVQKLIGVYLVGSLATGDFDLDSDIDFLAVTSDELTDQEVGALQVMHTRIHEMRCYPARHLEGSYISHAVLKQPEGVGVRPLWYLDNGSTVFERSTHDNKWHVRWVLRERGITLLGPGAASLLGPIPERSLAAEVAGTMQHIEGLFAADIDGPLTYWTSRFGQSFTVLTYCRMLHTLQAGTVQSKLAGMRWALEELDPEWSTLIEQAWTEREGVRHGIKIQRQAKSSTLTDTYAFIQYALREGANRFPSAFSENHCRKLRKAAPSGSRGVISSPLPHHRTCGSASGGSEGLP